MAQETKASGDPSVQGPPRLRQFAHVSVPCRDLEEGKRFYRDVLGGEMHVETPTFASFRLGGVDVGIGTDGSAPAARSRRSTSSGAWTTGRRRSRRIQSRHRFNVIR